MKNLLLGIEMDAGLTRCCMGHTSKIEAQRDGVASIWMDFVFYTNMGVYERQDFSVGYERIGRADTDLAAETWLHGEGVWFIRPRGHERGSISWAEISSP